MSDLSILWISVFFIAAALFFGTAVVLAVKGASDLRDLLKKSEPKPPS